MLIGELEEFLSETAAGDQAAADVRGIRGLVSSVDADRAESAGVIAPVFDLVTGERVA